MQAILYGKIQPAKAMDVAMITLDQAPQAYKEFDTVLPNVCP